MAAVASYLDAKANAGTWLVRMEDLDPPREPPGTADVILRQLEAMGLYWDQSVLYQSSRLDAYAAAHSELEKMGLCYRCDCSRQQVRELGSVYDGHCRSRQNPPDTDFAIRLRTDPGTISIADGVQGQYQQQLESDVGDFVIQRRDGRFSYQLAVVVDDAFQEITHIVRGSDLLDSTPRQIYLQQLLGYHTPHYAHIPVIVNEHGQKLSKQHFAESIDTQQAASLLLDCLLRLGLDPGSELQGALTGDILKWGARHWDIHAIPRLATIPQQLLPSMES